MDLDIVGLRKRTNLKLAELQAARIAYRTEVEAQESAKALSENSAEAQTILQQVAQQVQQQAHDQIANVVSRCLSAVFDEPYQFHIHFERKRGRTEASLTFERDGLEVDPMTAAGGGVVDVAAFALRLSCLLLSNPPLRRLLILDEPFKYVSAEYRHRVRELLETLSQEMKVQFVMVTHIDELKTGTVIQLG